MTDPATVEFAQALPYAVLPVSTQLAAFHAVRTSHPHRFCERCGTHPVLRTTVVRSAKLRSRSSHVVVSTCIACGQQSHTAFQKGDVSSFPPVRRQKKALDVNKETIPAPALEQVPTSMPSKRNKKSGLAEMLRRNRERDNTKNSPQPIADLSAFLTTLV